MKIEVSEQMYDQLINLSHKINFNIDRTSLPYGLSIPETQLVFSFISGLTSPESENIAQVYATEEGTPRA